MDKSYVTVRGKVTHFLKDDTEGSPHQRWIIEGIERYPENKVFIFNRWGDEINFLEHYDNTSVYWDGKNKHDKVLPDGTYYYVFYIKIDGQERTFTGWIFMHGAHQ